MAEKAKSRNRDWWSAELKKSEESGQSLAEYARQHGIKAGTMYRWKALLSGKSRESASQKAPSTRDVWGRTYGDGPRNIGS